LIPPITLVVILLSSVKLPTGDAKGCNWPQPPKHTILFHIYLPKSVNAGWCLVDLRHLTRSS